jgi:RNA polymerase sigma-70 factor (ECF subfamily)
MPECAGAVSDGLKSVAEDLEREFEGLLVESSRLAFRVAYAVLHHREDAEDIAQDALIKAHRNFRRLRQRDSFRAWLVRTTWRLALDRQKANRRRIARESRHQRTTTQVAAGDPVLAGAIWRAIEALPEKLRLAMILSGIHGHDVHAVAQLLEIPEGTVKSRLFLARERMKEMLKWIP